MAIQATHHTEFVLREMSHVAAEGIVSIPNFGRWTHAVSLLTGRMPVSREIPYQWYDTPNLHMATIKDFESLLARLGLVVTQRAYFLHGRRITTLADLRATQAVFRFRGRGEPASAGAAAAPTPAAVPASASGLVGAR